MSEEIRIVIADDHPIVPKGLRQAIEEEPDLKVIAEAGDGETALEIDFDRNVFQALEVDEGTFLPDTGATTWFPGIIDNTAGSISFIIESLASATGGVDTSHHGRLLLTARFQAIGASPGSTISIAPGSCFQTFVDIGTSDCSISNAPQSLDTSGIATITSVATTSAVPEPATFGLSLAFLSLSAVIGRLTGRVRKSDA
jgi:hypothetical protein